MTIKMNWGKWIIVSFVLFAMFIATLVTVCVRQDVLLVSKDYYQDELVYQEQIERIQNTNALQDKPEIVVVNNQLQVSYIRFANVDRALLKLFRPSDASLDLQFELKPVLEGKQEFSLSSLPRGFYRARMTWEEAGKEYYLEKAIVI
jgi:hypothetical protein